jgi:hypothetical protein
MVISRRASTGMRQNILLFLFLAFFLLAESPLSGPVNGLARGVLGIYDHILWCVRHGRRYEWAL